MYSYRVVMYCNKNMKTFTHTSDIIDTSSGRIKEKPVGGTTRRGAIGAEDRGAVGAENRGAEGAEEGGVWGGGVPLPTGGGVWGGGCT